MHILLIDRGALPNQPNWNPQCSYNQLLEKYIATRYSNSDSKVAVVFDGCDDNI